MYPCAIIYSVQSSIGDSKGGPGGPGGPWPPAENYVLRNLG